MVERGLEIGSSQPTQKLALIGAFGSGKTTLFNGLKRRLDRDLRFAFVEEAARAFLQFHSLTLVERNSLDIQRKIQEFIIESERKADDANASIILCDSSVLTTSMYLQGMGDRKGSLELLKAIEYWLPTYDSFCCLIAPMCLIRKTLFGKRVKNNDRETMMRILNYSLKSISPIYS